MTNCLQPQTMLKFLLTSTGFSLELGVKTLLIVENQLPFFPIFLVSHFFPKRKDKLNGKISRKMSSYDPESQTMLHEDPLGSALQIENIWKHSKHKKFVPN